MASEVLTADTRAASLEHAARVGTPVATATHSISRDEWIWLCMACLVILLVASWPLLWLIWARPASYHFSGIVWQPYDSALLLSTMWEGTAGHWLHTPPYMVDQSAGAFFYPEYIALGRLAAELSVEPALLFHLVRLAGGAALLLTLYAFVSRFFERVADRRLAFLLAATGSGLGWLAFIIVGVNDTPDLRQPESFPFYSLFSNLHFAWTMASLMWLIQVLVPPSSAKPNRMRDGLVLSVSGTMLGIMQPFGIVLAVGIAGLDVAKQLLGRQPWPWPQVLKIVLVVLVASPFVLHELSAINTLSAYEGWRDQVSNLSPSVVYYAIGVGLILPFALAGLVRQVRERAEDDLLVLWMLAVAALVYLPYYQNRRFAFGAFIPLALLATFAISRVRAFESPLRRFAFALIVTLSNLLLLASIQWTLSMHSPMLFLSNAEWDGIQFLRAHAPDRSLVLASPEMSVLIMATSDMRVVYGHPFETPHANETLAELKGFFDGTLADTDGYLRPIDYVFVGPRERSVLKRPIPDSLVPVFSDDDVTIFAHR